MTIQWSTVTCPPEGFVVTANEGSWLLKWGKKDLWNLEGRRKQGGQMQTFFGQMDVVVKNRASREG